MTQFKWLHLQMHQRRAAKSLKSSVNVRAIRCSCENALVSNYAHYDHQCEWQSSQQQVLWISRSAGCTEGRGTRAERREPRSCLVNLFSPKCSGSVCDTAAGVWLPYRAGLGAPQLLLRGDRAAPFMRRTARRPAVTRASTLLLFSAPDHGSPQTRLTFPPGRLDWEVSVCACALPPPNTRHSCISLEDF